MAESGEEKQVGPERFVTDVPRLDFITKGGLLKGASYAINGPPGSGKTVLSNHLAFNHVKHGGRALYVTLLTESHARMLANLEGMSFYDASAVPDKIRYISAFRDLERDGLAGMLDVVRREAHEHRATLLVVDGMDVAKQFAPSTLALKRFIQDLQAFTSMLRCTTLLLAPHHDGEVHPENTAVDGVFQLSLRLVGPRAVRELAALKFRGSDSLLGKHEVEISSSGITIHPRTEVHFSDPNAFGAAERVRMKFGIPQLDEALRGGVLSGSTTMLLGAPGTGKTLLALHFLVEGARRGQPGVYFGFYEPPPRLFEKAAGVGMPDLEAFVKQGLVEIQWQPPLEHNLDALAERLLERLHERDAKRMRLVVDGLQGFRTATVYPDRMGRFFSALSQQLRLLDATTLYTEETPLLSSGVDVPDEGVAGYVENIVLLRYVEHRASIRRLVSIMKVRESPYDGRIREFRITEHGIEMANTFASSEMLLTGHARVVGPGASGIVLPTKPTRRASAKTKTKTKTKKASSAPRRSRS